MQCNQKNDENLDQAVVSLLDKSKKVSQDSTFFYLSQAKVILKGHLDLPDSLRAENNYLMGEHFYSKNELDSASVYFHNATDYVRDSMTNSRERDYFYRAWNAYYTLGKYGDCFTLSDKLRSRISKDDYLGYHLSYYLDEFAFKGTRQYLKAVKSNNLRIAVLKKAHDTVKIPDALLARADIMYNNLNDKEEIFSILDSLIQKKESLSNKNLGNVYLNYGVYLFFEKEYLTSLNSYKLALKHRKKDLNNNGSLIRGYSNIAEVLIELNDFKKAQTYLDSAYSFGLNNINHKDRKNLMRYQLRLSTSNSNEYKILQQLLDSLSIVQDNVYNKKINTELKELSQANQEKELILINNQESELAALRFKWALIVAAIASILFILIGYLFYRQRKLKFERQDLQMQQRLLQSQMNPHFTFNTLNVIQNQISVNPNSAKNYLLKFSRLLRLILENSTSNYIQLDQVIESLKKYMDLQLLRYPDLFFYEIKIENMVEDDLIFIPPMLIQPFIENSIEHGFSSIDYSGEIKLTLEKNKDFIVCSIEDNGSGYDLDKQESKRVSSVKLISRFLEKLTKKEIEIIDKSKGNKELSGIITKILIPYKYSEYD